MERFGLIAGWMLVSACAGAAFVNWEHNPVHPVDVSPSGAWLAVANLPAAQVELFLVDPDGIPLPIASIPVGLDPMTVRFRNESELWAVNHVSDSISVIDVTTQRVTATIPTGDEPSDVVFAGNPVRAFVSCSQVNEVWVIDPETRQTVTVIPIMGEEPRALAVAADGSEVYAAIFESGNNTTILPGGFTGLGATLGSVIHNVVSDAQGPHGGANPPPNAGTGFEPPLNPAVGTGLPVSLIVRKDPAGRWRDDTGADWTAYVSGPRAPRTGRLEGWDLYDHDLAVINAADFAVTYRTGLMNINMALAVNPRTGEVTVVGTDAKNERRYEPNLRGDFIEVRLARVPTAGGAVLQDLNPHVSGRASIPKEERRESLSDPRGIRWSSGGGRGWVTGMGTNNLITIREDGTRDPVRQALELGEGPTGIASSPDERMLYVYNRFDGTLSVVDEGAWREVRRLRLFDPTPASIREGRRFLYNSHLTSGNGVHSCASCHVDMRHDRLAWDLGDPTGISVPVTSQDHNTQLIGFGSFGSFHPMKGPMLTQTLQDIIGHEPLHWRGDRLRIEEFNETFTALQAADRELHDDEMARVKEFLKSLTFAPNPYRNLDNTLSTNVPLKGLYRTGRFGSSNRGQPMPAGNAVRGLNIYTTVALDRAVFTCVACHALGTGGGVNYRVRSGGGFDEIPLGPGGERRLTMVNIDGATNVAIKVPQMRNLHERLGFDFNQLRNTSGFGTFHDGTLGSVADFVSIPDFSFNNEQQVADVIALVFSLAGGGFEETIAARNLLPAPPSRDVHAGVGQMRMIRSVTSSAAAEELRAIAAAGVTRVELVARTSNEARARGWLYRPSIDRFRDDLRGEGTTLTDLLQTVTEETPLLMMLVPAGMGARLSIDQDGDGFEDGVELAIGTDPFDPSSFPRRSLFGIY